MGEQPGESTRDSQTCRERPPADRVGRDTYVRSRVSHGMPVQAPTKPAAPASIADPRTAIAS
ncbi:hypothetical protein GCM10020219_048940 [Nonomuraea dietziae]